MMSASQPANKPTIVKHGLESTPKQSSGPAKQAFIATTLNMSWQMAVVFLVPVFLGTLLDKHFHAEPLWTIVGFAFGIAGVSVVVWRQMKILQNLEKGSDK